MYRPWRGIYITLYNYHFTCFIIRGYHVINFFFFCWTLLSGIMMLLCPWVLGLSFLRKLKWLFYWWTQQPETVIVPSKHLAIGYENFWNNMKVLIRVMKTWGRFMLGYQNLKAYETWLPKLLSKFSNPFCLGTQDY